VNKKVIAMVEKLIEKTKAGEVAWRKPACRSFCATFSSKEIHLHITVKEELGEGREMEIFDLGGSRIQTESAYVNGDRNTTHFRLLKLLYRAAMEMCRNERGQFEATPREIESEN
jgi:hypothetical protein